MQRIVIGIHGLENKPGASTERRWWRRALREGLARGGLPAFGFRFEMAYWADVLHEQPLDPRIKDPDDPRYIDEVYLPSQEAPQAARPARLRKRLLGVLERAMGTILTGRGSPLAIFGLEKKLISRTFPDLAIYYHGNCRQQGRELPAREAIAAPLRRLLARHRRKRILLVAHSMGTIIAYDVLGGEETPTAVHTLVTLGSPLGLPIVMKYLRRRKADEGKPFTAPESVTDAWHNLADLADPVALDFQLADDYGPNSSGVGPTDHVVRNDYRVGRNENHHKSYGYLRTPEMAAILAAFLGKDRGPLARAVTLIRTRLRDLFRRRRPA